MIIVPHTIDVASSVELTRGGNVAVNQYVCVEIEPFAVGDETATWLMLWHRVYRSGYGCRAYGMLATDGHTIASSALDAAHIRLRDYTISRILRQCMFSADDAAAIRTALRHEKRRVIAHYDRTGECITLGNIT